MDRETFTRQHADAESHSALFTFLADSWDGSGGYSPPLDEILESGTYGSTMNLEEFPTWKGSSYVDRFPRESLEKYRSRVRRAHYVNIPRTVGDTICGFLLSREPTRNTTHETLLRFEEDADGLGHSWDDLLRNEIARRLWLFASPLILVDRPAYEADSKLDEPGTYATILPPQMLYDWETDAAGELLWAKLVENRTECEGAAAERVTYALATEWTREGWTRWRMDEDKDVQPYEIGSGTHPCGRVPLVVGSMCRPIGQSILGTSESFEICQETRKLYNYQSLLDDHLYGQVFAVLAVTKPELSQQGGFKLGTDNALMIPSGGQASYIAPPQSVSETLFKAIEQCIRRIYRAARLEFTLRDTGQAESGVSRQYEFSATNRALCSMAAELARIEREVKRMVLAWEGVDGEAADTAVAESTPMWPDNYDVRDLEREMKIALDAMTLPIGETARKKLIKTVRDDVVDLTPEEREQSDKEIDEGETIAKGPEADLGSNPPADDEPQPVPPQFDKGDEEEGQGEQPPAEEA
jgi:hypothetical protein